MICIPGRGYVTTRSNVPSLPLGRLRDLEQKRVNKELANIRYKFKGGLIDEIEMRWGSDGCDMMMRILLILDTSAVL